MNFKDKIVLSKDEATALKNQLITAVPKELAEIQEDPDFWEDDDYREETIKEYFNYFSIINGIPQKPMRDVIITDSEVIRDLYFFLDYNLIRSIREDEYWDNATYAANLFAVYTKTKPIEE